MFDKGYAKEGIKCRMTLKYNAVLNEVQAGRLQKPSLEKTES